MKFNKIFYKRTGMLFNGMTQMEVSALTGIAQSAVSKILNYPNGNTKYLPSAETVYKIAKAFNVSTDYLLGLTDVKTIGTKTHVAYSDGFREGYKAAKEDIKDTVEEMQRVMKGILGEVDSKLKSQEE